MKKFTNLSEMMGNVDEEIFNEIQYSLGEEADSGKSFEELLGGDIFLIGTPEDLKEVQATGDEGYVDIRSKTGGFDAAFYFPSKNWVFLFLANSDAGGPAFIAPMSIAKHYITIEESIRQANPDGKLVRTFRGPLVEITRVSPASGRIHTKVLPFTETQLRAHINGVPLHSSMPQLTSNEAEFVMSGITGEEWNLVYADDA
jgi:hypothetical protein